MNMIHRFANWIDEPHPVEYLLNGGTGGVEPASQTKRNRDWLAGDDFEYEGGFTAGELVNDLTAFGVSPFNACVKALSDGGALVDINIYYDNGDLVPLPLCPAWATDTPIRGLTDWAFYKRTFAGGLTRGLAALEIVRKNPDTGLPDVLRPLPTGYRYLTLTNSSMSPGYAHRRDAEPAVVRYSPGWEREGDYRELIEWMGPGDEEGQVVVPRYDDDGTLEGRSILRSANRVIGLALATSGHAELFHLTGGRPLWIMSAPAGTPDEAMDALEAGVRKVRSQKLSRFMAMLVQGDIKVQELTASAKESQLVEAREVVNGEICRLFTYPAQLMGTQASTAWTTGMAELKRTVITFALQPWLRWLESALSWTLPPGQTARFDMMRAMKGDPEKAAETAAKMVAAGIWTVNEGRIYTDHRPIPGMDKLVTGMDEAAALDAVTRE